MARLDTNAYYALGIPAYGLVMWLEHVWAARRGARVYRLPETIANLSAGLGEIVIGLLLGPALLLLYDYGYQHIALVHWAPGSVVPWVLAFVGGDLCYYLYHRAGHRVGLFWAIHGVHHQSGAFNFSVAMRHPWFSDTYAVLFYIPMPMLGVTPKHFFFAIAVISFYALTVHTRYFHRPSLGIFVTPQTHIVHHATNPRYLDRNFGAMFSVWDRIFGTHVEVHPQEPPVIGCLSGTQTYSGARAQWIFFADLIARIRASHRWRDKLRVLYMPPGYLPQNRHDPLPAVASARPISNIPRRLQQIMGLLFITTLGGASWILWQQDNVAQGLQLALIVLVLGSLAFIGKQLDVGA
jgi:alkylglycerol monooxygenase